jgi:hypothetical protein
MGYYTDFKLRTDKHVPDLGKKINEISGYSFDDDTNYYIGSDELNSLQCYDIKWYEHETHMRKISKNHKNVLFTLEGNGEEEGDMWVKYFLNGKMQKVKAEITFQPFDKTKLQ